jgi:general secretion pathway protein A
MYARHFGISFEPFSLTPDPTLLYRSPGHVEALAALQVGLRGRCGLLVMTGEVGTGKTTLLYALLAELGPQIRTAYLANTKLGFDDMLRLMLADLDVACPGADRVAMLMALNELLRDCATKGDTVALIIDEAQNLDDESFEHLRLLSNYETFDAKLLQIVLVGQPELEAKLRRPGLRQVAERVAVHCRIAPLSRRESRAYIEHRLRCAGGSLALFSLPARRLLVRKAQGIPRRLNILCHNAMLFAYASDARRVTRAMARRAIRARRHLVGSSPLRWAANRRRAASATVGAALVAVAGGVGARHYGDYLVRHSGEPAVAVSGVMVDAPPRPLGLDPATANAAVVSAAAAPPAPLQGRFHSDPAMSAGAGIAGFGGAAPEQAMHDGQPSSSARDFHAPPAANAVAQPGRIAGREIEKENLR